MATGIKTLRPRLPALGQSPAARGWAETRTASASDRGYGHAWRKARERVLLRDNGLCQPCRRRDLVTPATDVDHITPRFEGGTDDDGNLQAICPDCHKAKTAEESARARLTGSPVLGPLAVPGRSSRR